MWPQDSQATPNTSQGLLFAAEVKCMARPIPRAAYLPRKSHMGMILDVLVLASFLAIGWKS